MNDRVPYLAASILLIAATVAVFGITVANPDAVDALRRQLQNDDSKDDGRDGDRDAFVHKHAHVYFLVDGERKNLSDAYIERSHHVHFHHDDGIIHVEGRDANVSTMLETLDIAVNETCVRYGLDNETYCGQGDTELRFVANGDNLTRQDWLNHTIQQGDNIVLFHGNASMAVPDRYLTPLPEGYRPGFDRL